ncbi:low molecular weight phosphatase family protein [Gordonia sp. OPL2]|uniref:arsenate-mycothiol transferase ArsC n=1 Tax=Gordonia sp. OPL2 TaxID=2486274 RepID=UPI0016563C12|nr:low molecular weight phosphatase family protein [Gordonia sp. OPL2]RPA19893.1 low molecular weight phosphatase family protein [Gordonia sp. OPL2]
MSPEPKNVLFVCVSNRGKSVMAEHLTAAVTDQIRASSAGTAATIGGGINDLAAQVLAEVGAVPIRHSPRQLTDDLMRTADLVVVVGTAEVSPPAGVTVEVWDTDEPSARGIDGIDRMRMIRDDITERIGALIARLSR